jgi:multidrug resistance efflux pump
VTQRIPVRVEVDDMRADRPLRPGMSVETYVKVK